MLEFPILSQTLKPRVEQYAMDPNDFRIEKDSMGELRVPRAALWGAQTQRAIENFPVSGQRLPPPLIHAIAQVKRAAAAVNQASGRLDGGVAAAIIAAADEVIDRKSVV